VVRRHYDGDPVHLVACAIVLFIAACARAEPADETLGPTVLSKKSGRRVTPLLRVSPDARDRWVLRLEGGSAAAELELPSVSAPGEATRKVSRRAPHLFWSDEGERLVAETIGSGFLVVYFPPGQRPFACPHRVLRATDVPLASRGAPTLEALVEEMLTDPDKPHDAAEQQTAFDDIRRAGPAGPRGEVLTRAAILASSHVDLDGLAALLRERLAGLPAAERDLELARLGAALRSDEPPERFGAAAVRVARALGEAGAHDYGGDVATALARVVRISAAPTNAPKVVDAARWLAWAAGVLRAQAARDPLRAYLDVPFEVPFRTRVARSVAAWALVRLGDPEIVGRVDRWSGPSDRSLPASGGAVPGEAEALAGPAWAEKVSSARVAEWVRREALPTPPRSGRGTGREAPARPGRSRTEEAAPAGR